MPRVQEGQTLAESFNEQYRSNRAQVMREMERIVCGCDYGGTSWTTRSEAEQIARLLGLRPGKRLLEVGSGSGWPALYMARTTGCEAVLVDVPEDAIGIAAERARSERLTDQCAFAVADGGLLPFPDGTFDLVSHSDVLCCLEDKSGVLRTVRRVVRNGARMVFSVISVTPGLSTADHARAIEAGPPFVESDASYIDLLVKSGWDLEDVFDLTTKWEASHRLLLHEQEARTDELNALLGHSEHSQRMTGNRAAIDAIEAGLLKRELFVANAI